MEKQPDIDDFLQKEGGTVSIKYHRDIDTFTLGGGWHSNWRRFLLLRQGPPFSCICRYGLSNSEHLRIADFMTAPGQFVLEPGGEKAQTSAGEM